MADLDIPAILEASQALVLKIEIILRGLRNDECADDNPVEKAKIQEAILSFNMGLAKVKALEQDAQDLSDWGYPPLPTFEVPETMVQNLLKSENTTHEANKVFVSAGPAAAKIRVSLSEPRPKE